MNDKLIQEVETFVNNYFNENDSEKLVYHDIFHTVEVVKAVRKIGVGNSQEASAGVCRNIWHTSCSRCSRFHGWLLPGIRAP